LLNVPLIVCTELDHNPRVFILLFEHATVLLVLTHSAKRWSEFTSRNQFESSDNHLASHFCPDLEKTRWIASAHARAAIMEDAFDGGLTDRLAAVLMRADVVAFPLVFGSSQWQRPHCTFI
jgi:hypothetical protein